MQPPLPSLSVLALGQEFLDLAGVTEVIPSLYPLIRLKLFP